MNKSVADFVRLEKSISAKRGKFSLFALFEREDLPNRWDLVVSAPWALNQSSVSNYLLKQIESTIGNDKLVELSRIVVVPPDQPAVKALNRAMHVEHSSAEITNSDFFGVRIKHGFLITSQSLASPTPK